jgi:tetratricopeptide (TPR) repeat protein
VTVVVAALVVAGTLRSRQRQRVWRDNATLFAQTAEDAPLSYRAQFFYGQLLFQQGRRAEGERRLKLAIALNPTPSDVSPLNFLATEYRDAGLCPQALPLYERALANDEERPDVRYGMAACLLETGRVGEARHLAQDGVRRGDLKTLFLQLIARSDSLASRGG